LLRRFVKRGSDRRFTRKNFSNRKEVIMKNVFKKMAALKAAGVVGIGLALMVMTGCVASIR